MDFNAYTDFCLVLQVMMRVEDIKTAKHISKHTSLLN